jgi:hypothetical protein
MAGGDTLIYLNRFKLDRVHIAATVCGFASASLLGIVDHRIDILRRLRRIRKM